MSKILRVFSNLAIAFFLGIWGGIIALFFAALIYIATAKIAAVFHKTIFNPTRTMAEIVYATFVVAIGVWTYIYIERRSRKCITA